MTTKQIMVLDGQWEFREFPESARRMRDLDDSPWTPARVPGSIYTHLMEAGCFSRFDVEANPEDFGWVSQCAWVYRRTFTPTAEMVKAAAAELVFEGLDTITQIWLNEKLIGKTDNMFIPHRLSVGGLLREGVNTLMIKFLPALDYAERLMQHYGKLSDLHYGDPRRSYIRKAQYQFGSAMCPSLPGCGIFRSVRLEAYDIARLDEVHIRTIDCDQHNADVRAAVRICRADESAHQPLTVRLTISGGGLVIEQMLDFQGRDTQNATVIRIERPIFWQPAGYGVPHLYRLTATLLDADGGTLDTHETDFGIRTIRVQRGDMRQGQAFRFEVNDSPVYIKGANWMPLSMFPGEQTPADYERILTQLKKIHINMLRVWGGGLYEDETFYRLCDKLGILVWQDFAFVSAYYPDRPWFAEMVQREAEAVVRRLRNHPCLAIWCGNSRIDHLHQTGRLGGGRKFYGRAIYHKLLPELLAEFDPDREYIPTTPLGSPNAKDLNDPSEGTHHFWQVWNQFSPVGELLFDKAHIPRFLCEFGMQSYPSRACIERMCPPPRRVIGSAAMEKHDYQSDGDGRTARYAAELFAAPHTLNEYAEQTQLVQARAIKLCVEHLRAHNTTNSGLLIWTANECAPSIGFSMIDACGAPKAAYYYARRCFAPRLVTVLRDRQAYLNGHLRSSGVVVINDAPLPLTATVQCRCLDFHGRVIDAMEYPVAVAPFGKSAPRMLPRGLACPQTPNRCLLHLAVVAAEGTLAENSFFYLPDKHLDWPTATIEMEMADLSPQRRKLRLTARTVVRDVSIIPPTPATLSDNFLTLLPHQPYEVEMVYAQPAPSMLIPIVLRSIPCGL